MSGSGADGFPPRQPTAVRRTATDRTLPQGHETRYIFHVLSKKTRKYTIIFTKLSHTQGNNRPGRNTQNRKGPDKKKKHFTKAQLHTPRHENACTSLTLRESLKQYFTSEHGKTAG